MIIDIESDWRLPTQGMKPHTITVLKSRSTGKSNLQLAYNIRKLITIWDEWYNFDDELGVDMEKAHYQHFVRLYNRKKRQRFHELNAAGYSYVKTSNGFIAQRDWCKANLKPGTWISGHNYFWFAYDNDAVLFKMHWL